MLRKLGHKNTLRNLSSRKFEELSKERKVPTNKLNRIITYGGLFGKIGSRIIFDKISHSNSGSKYEMNEKLSREVSNDIVNVMCKLRGAALKFGQMISIQDDTIVPKHIHEIFDRVRQMADYMPFNQVNAVLSKEFGRNWKENFNSFDTKPFAAASIGQVHSAFLKDGTKVAVKIQYPDIENSILIDLRTLSLLFERTNLFPPGLFLYNMVQVAERELFWEVDYKREADYQEKIRDMLISHKTLSLQFYIPKIIKNLTSKKVITMEYQNGVSIDNLFLNTDSKIRNQICNNIINLTLNELFIWKCMQTDANWSNFLYDNETNKVILLDFGASKDFSKGFIDDYINIIRGAADKDREKVISYSNKLGFFSGYENQEMISAHVEAVMTLGLPFHSDNIFDFREQDITKKIGDLVPTMLKYRLKPPPEDTYALHRKMSGIFLLCSKLNAKIACKQLFEDLWKQYNNL